VSCRNLKDLDLVSVTDPMAEIMYKKSSKKDAPWEMLGKTEVVWNDLNPNFSQSFLLDYHFEVSLYLKVIVYHMKSEKLKGDALGEIECSLHEIAGARGQQLRKPLKLESKPSEPRGDVLLSIEEVADGDANVVDMDIAAEGLKSVNCFLCSNKPMLAISRAMESGTMQRVYTSEVKSGNSPDWRQCTISVQKLCNNDLSRPLRFEVFHYNSNGNHVLIGQADISLSEITEEGKKNFELGAGKGPKTGQLRIKSLQMRTQATFLDYIAGGCDINLVCAIDYTGSNGHWTNTNSLHYLRPDGEYNEYEKALYAVGEILLYYDTDKKVPLYGFGAELKSRGTQHCFALNMDESDPEVDDLNGLMSAYRSSFNSISSLSGPTNFAPVLGKSVKQAKDAAKNPSDQTYIVLLIITDGIISDLQASIDKIVEGSTQPLSIVIVGVGKADFKKMDILDADDDPLVSTSGVEMASDIVQFVPFRECENDIDKLRREVLDEIPRQLTDYFERNNIRPKPKIERKEPVAIATDNIAVEVKDEEDKEEEEA